MHPPRAECCQCLPSGSPFPDLCFQDFVPSSCGPAFSLCSHLHLRSSSSLIPNPYGPMERSPVLRGYGSDISHILGTLPGSPLRAWQTPAVTLNLSHGQAEDISPPCRACQVSGHCVWFGDRSSAVTWGLVSFGLRWNQQLQSQQGQTWACSLELPRPRIIEHFSE